MTTVSDSPEEPARKRVGRPPGRKPAREIIRDSVNQGVTKRRVDGIIDQALSAEVTVNAECPECGHEMKAKAPDVKKQMDVLIALLEQAEGRPEQRAPGELQVVIERPGR